MQNHTLVSHSWARATVELENLLAKPKHTRENFGRPGITDYRNPHLAESMYILGYVQRFGMGIQIARKLLFDNGNPPLSLLLMISTSWQQ